MKFYYGSLCFQTMNFVPTLPVKTSQYSNDHLIKLVPLYNSSTNKLFLMFLEYLNKR